MCYYVYILLSLKDKNFYIGYSTNLKQRINYHRKGLVKSTKNRRPLKLIFYEVYLKKDDAKRREKYFKTTDGKKALKIMLRKTLLIINNA
ncbi:MAG TPA: GIY-YIG nuclease family protein [Patescibacteria group bacterium]|nr:GIY-YIG nuclease family protein [Patescibacteria group bacterium]